MKGGQRELPARFCRPLLTVPAHAGHAADAVGKDAGDDFCSGHVQVGAILGVIEPPLRHRSRNARDSTADSSTGYD